MPKAIRQQIRPRGVVNVNDSFGNIGTPAATNSSSMGQLHAPIDITRDLTAGALWEGLSGTFGQLSKMAAEAQAGARSGGGRRGGGGGEDGENKAVMDAIDRISGEAAGIALLAEVEKKTRAGEMDFTQAREYIIASMQGENPSSAYMKKFEPYALKGVQAAGVQQFDRAQAEQAQSFAALARQSFNDIHGAYDPDNYDAYAQARTTLFESRKTLGISGQAIDEMEMISLSNAVTRTIQENPIKAFALLDLAERQRPDGSPSLAATAPNGYATVNTLRATVAAAILTDSENEKKESAATLKETTYDNYVNSFMALNTLESPETRQQWIAENFDGLSDEEFKAKYGDYRDKMFNTVQAAKSNQKPVGNEAAMTEHTYAIGRGTAEWQDIENDDRLNGTQKAHFFNELKKATQDARLGYISDASAAASLLGELESGWSHSVFGTPYSASIQSESGKPPTVSPEGLFYQGELLKRLRQLDPATDVNESNRRKLEVVQDVRNEILSGRLRWADNAGSLPGPFPQLKLSEKVREGQRLSPAEVSEVAKAFNGGGIRQVRDRFGVDFYAMDGEDQRHIAGEAQRQKAEIDALKSQSFLTRTREGFRNTLGLPEPQYDAFEWSQQVSAEASRLSLDGMELDSAVMLGTFRHEDPPEIVGERLANTVENEQRRVVDLEAELEEERNGLGTLSNLRASNTDQRLTKQKKALKDAEDRLKTHQQDKDRK